MIGPGKKIVLKFFWAVAQGSLRGRSGIQAKNYRYAEVSQMKIEGHEPVQYRWRLKSESLLDY